MLVKPLDLNVSDWEVGLAEFIFPYSWKNVCNGRFKIRMLVNDKWLWKDVAIPECMYNSKEQLVETMNEHTNKYLEDQRSRIIFN